MIQIVLLILILLLPIPTEAAYKIYLKDGSVISDVGYYEKKGSDVSLFFDYGSMQVSEEDILRIEEEESVGSYMLPEDDQGIADDTSVTAPREQASDRNERIAKLRAIQAEVYALNEEIREVNIEEARLVTTINDINSKPTWNQYQVLEIEREVKPYAEQLRAVQQKKIDLLEKKGALETEIREMQKK
jgi:hypothetical protein